MPTSVNQLESQKLQKIFQSLPDNYSPLNDKDGYMNDRHRAYFFNKLMTQYDQAAKEMDQFNESLRLLQSNPNTTDDIDLASIENELSSTLKSIERHAKFLKRIQLCIESLLSGDYGYCKETGDEIGIKRLMAVSTAVYCLEVQEQVDEQRFKHNIVEQF